MTLQSSIKRTVKGLLAFAALWSLIVAGCGGDDATAPSQENNTIGPGGGTVTDRGGAAVSIPAGALSEETEIDVATYIDSDACPSPTGPVPGFVGGAMFGPHGTQFAVPVTVTIPCNRVMTPGSTFPLFVWSEADTAWEQTGFIATVAGDGHSFSAEVTHFSTFGGFDGVGSGGMFGDLDEALCLGGDPGTVVNSFIELFRQEIANVGDRGIYEQKCKEVKGIDFDIAAEIGGQKVDVFFREGEKADESVMFVYSADCTSGQSAGGYVDATVVIYYECSAPELRAAADPSHVDQHESSTVMATLTCGGAAFPGQTIQFECFGDGEITPDDAVTNPAGQAQTMYNAPDQNGQATVTAYYDACEGEDNAQTIQASAGITVGGSWSGTLVVTFSHPIGNPPLVNFSDVLIVEFDFEIAEGVITGTGTGSHSIDITPGGNCTLTSLSAPDYGFVVGGTATDQTLQFQVVPDGLMPINFVITCMHGDDPVDYPYPPYGALEGSIIAMHIGISTARQDGASDAGSGSEDWGEGLPMYYSYTVTVNHESP